MYIDNFYTNQTKTRWFTKKNKYYVFKIFIFFQKKPKIKCKEIQETWFSFTTTVFPHRTLSFPLTFLQLNFASFISGNWVLRHMSQCHHTIQQYSFCDFDSILQKFIWLWIQFWRFLFQTRAQSFTSFDGRSLSSIIKIHSRSSFSKRLNGTFPCRNCSV